MYKILTTVVLSGLLLAGCAGTSVFVDDLQTSFTVELTETPTITEEEKAIGRELSEHVSQSEEFLTDRDHVKNASDNYPNHTYEELYDIYDRYFEDIFHGDKGEYYVTPTSLFAVYGEVIESNIVAGVVTRPVEQLLDRETGNDLRITGDYGTVGQPAKIFMWLEIDDETSEATLVRLTVDDEETVIN